MSLAIWDHTVLAATCHGQLTLLLYKLLGCCCWSGL